MDECECVCMSYVYILVWYVCRWKLNRSSTLNSPVHVSLRTVDNAPNVTTVLLMSHLVRVRDRQVISANWTLNGTDNTKDQNATTSNIIFLIKRTSKKTKQKNKKRIRHSCKNKTKQKNKNKKQQ